MKVNLSQDSGRDSLRALTRKELLVVIAMVLIVGLIGLSSASKQSARAKRVQCVSRLKDLGMAARGWPGPPRG